MQDCEKKYEKKIIWLLTFQKHFLPYTKRRKKNWKKVKINQSADLQVITIEYCLSFWLIDTLKKDDF